MVKRKITLIGVFVVLSLALLIWGVNYLNGTNILKNRQSYYAIYKQVGGLVKTSPVLLNGYQIGQVGELNFTAPGSGKLIAKISVEADIKLPQKTIAEIASIDLTGTKGIRIIPGVGKGFHESGDTLISRYQEALTTRLMGQIDPLKLKAERLIATMDTLVNKTSKIVDQNNQKHVSNILANVSQLSKNLNLLIKKNQDTLKQSIARIDTVSATFEKNAANLDTTMQNLRAISDSLRHSKLKSTLLALNKIASNIKDQKGTMGSLVYNDTLYQNLENTTGELEKLLRDIQKNPKKYVHFSLFGN